MSVATYQVSGMTCGHCAQAVSAEISAIESVTGVEVDVATGTVTVSGAASAEAVAAAVDEAGYTLVSPS